MSSSGGMLGVEILGRIHVSGQMIFKPRRDVVSKHLSQILTGSLYPSESKDLDLLLQ